MSVKLMAKAWEMPIPSGQKMVLLALCDHANDDGACYPSQNKIAQKCSMSMRAIVRHIKWLENHGILVKERRQNTNIRKSNLYLISLDNYQCANSACANSAHANLACANSAHANLACANSAHANLACDNLAHAKLAHPNVTITSSECAKLALTLYDEPSGEPSGEPSSGGGGAGAPPTPPAESCLPVEGKTASAKSTPANPDNVQTWRSYAKAYRDRYGVLPESNAQTRGQVAKFVRLVGVDKAVVLAAYYVGHNLSWFVRDRHPFGYLLKAYQQVATDWARDEQMTGGKARQAEQTQSNFDTAKRVLAKRQARRQQQEAGQ